MAMFWGELVGTALLVLFGNGVVANVVLARTKGHNSGWIVITTGWGLAVAVAVYCVGRISGAHLNPAVTVALTAIGSFEIELLPTYIGGQLLGAVLGAVLVWLAYRSHFAATADKEGIRACFCTTPAIRALGDNFITEALGTGVLVFGILAIGANAGELGKIGPLDLQAVFSKGLNPLLVGLLVLGIGLSLGGPTGYAINPARDLGPRLAHAFLPIPGKGDSDWRYAWVPVVAPLAGGTAGAFFFRALAF